MIYFIVFLPLIGFLYCAFFGNKFDEKYSQLFTSLLLIIATIFSWIVFFNFTGPTETEKYILFNWISSGNFSADWSF